VGRPVDLDGEHTWLRAPMASESVVRDNWLAETARAAGGTLSHDVAEGGLLEDMARLDGPGFSAADLHPDVRDFYEHTASWRMEVWTGWEPLFWPGGEVISRLFGKRVGQLALPMRSLDVAHGMDSRVSLITDAEDRRVGAAWLRTLRSTGDFVYSGCYSHRRLPGAERDSIHVAFPLEEGNVQVFLRPEADADGSLWLHSGAGPFGADGAYVVVRHREREHASRAPIRERFHVYLDAEGVLRTDHELRLWGARVVRLHYRLDRRVRRPTP